MLKNKKDQEKLREFFEETKNINSEEKKNSSETHEPASKSLSKPYTCPSCHRSLSSRKEGCKHCGYKKYIPMSDEQIKKIKFVLFFIILAIAIVVYVLTR